MGCATDAVRFDATGAWTQHSVFCAIFAIQRTCTTRPDCVSVQLEEYKERRLSEGGTAALRNAIRIFDSKEKVGREFEVGRDQTERVIVRFVIVLLLLRLLLRWTSSRRLKRFVPVQVPVAGERNGTCGVRRQGKECDRWPDGCLC